jgi:hypothetical protein
MNWAEASRVAARIGPERVSDLLAVMVYPPEAPAERSALEWLPRVHYVVCQVVAQLDDGWVGSIRRDALYSILLGPTDWTTIAAIQILAKIGRTEEVYAPDIHTAFQKLADHRPDRGYCCWLRPLYAAWLQLPHLFPKERKEFERVLQRIDREST